MCVAVGISIILEESVSCLVGSRSFDNVLLLAKTLVGNTSLDWGSMIVELISSDN